MVDLKYNMELGESSEPPARTGEDNKAGGSLRGRNTLRGKVRAIGHKHVKKGGKGTKNGCPVENGVALPFLFNNRLHKLRRSSDGLAHKVLVSAMSNLDLLTGKLDRRK